MSQEGGNLITLSTTMVGCNPSLDTPTHAQQSISFQRALDGTHNSALCPVIIQHQPERAENSHLQQKKNYFYLFWIKERPGRRRAGAFRIAGELD
jgi:hypothetical protein